MTLSPPAERLVADVREGLSRSPKELAPKYFYDERGSKLFDRITTLVEYYPTRCERAILNRNAPEIVEGMEELVELGSGTASKTRALLYAMAGAGSLRRYVPFDVDGSVVALCEEELTELYPGLAVHGVVGDFEHDLGRIPPGERRLFAFLGGTIGNFQAHERAEFLTRVRALMGPTDRMVLGTDLVKDRATLEAAYDDREGVTAEFNRNLLRVLNDGLGADFDPQAFEHVARWVEEGSRIEMLLRSVREQTVSIPGADLEVSFAEGEEMLTEISTKFTPARIEAELGEAGLALGRLLTDPDGLFAVSVSAALISQGVNSIRSR
ncbi:MAG: L-histidine N(alpha)-methyltransferase [Actinomycetota bacterium]|nr:L-histidine N(alpha)-methyltransferase [Actinomycetota bacterium]